MGDPTNPVLLFLKLDLDPSGSSLVSSFVPFTLKMPVLNAYLYGIGHKDHSAGDSGPGIECYAIQDKAIQILAVWPEEAWRIGDGKGVVEEREVQSNSAAATIDDASQAVLRKDANDVVSEEYSADVDVGDSGNESESAVPVVTGMPSEGPAHGGTIDSGDFDPLSNWMGNLLGEGDAPTPAPAPAPTPAPAPAPASAPASAPAPAPAPAEVVLDDNKEEEKFDLMKVLAEKGKELAESNANSAESHSSPLLSPSIMSPQDVVAEDLGPPAPPVEAPAPAPAPTPTPAPTVILKKKEEEKKQKEATTPPAKKVANSNNEGNPPEKKTNNTAAATTAAATTEQKVNYNIITQRISNSVTTMLKSQGGSHIFRCEFLS